MTTTQHITPGTILAVAQDSWHHPSYLPKVSNALYTVSRVTPTQAIAAGSNGEEIRVRIKDIGLIGKGYKRAAIADDEIQAEHAAQMNELARFRSAYRQTDDLISRPLHQLKLSTDQLEALATAWVQIKAMKPQP